MQSFNLKPRSFGFVVGTRAALAFGLGLLAASRIPEGRRKRIGLALLGLGVATTVPAVRMLRRSRTPLQAPEPEPLNGSSFDGTHSEFGFARQM
ncbi:MAG TPA: hypothetical protein VFO31_21905 [Vicinamibacterales bacterium]|nr:hypothetical protein [Vicinamibacterales bacterium]